MRVKYHAWITDTFSSCRWSKYFSFLVPVWLSRLDLEGGTASPMARRMALCVFRSNSSRHKEVTGTIIAKTQWNTYHIHMGPYQASSQGIWRSLFIKITCVHHWGRGGSGSLPLQIGTTTQFLFITLVCPYILYACMCNAHSTEPHGHAPHMYGRAATFFLVVYENSIRIPNSRTGLRWAKSNFTSLQKS